MNVWLLILICWLGVAVVMALLWVLQRIQGDSGVVDVAWGLGVGLISLVFAIFSEGDPTRRVIVAGLAIAWAMRLSGYILVRLFQLPEDGRYVTIKENWGDKAQANLFWFFQIQAFWAVLFALPMLMASRNPLPFPSVWDYLGLAIWILAIAGESIADRQLARFRNNPTTKGEVCRDGLWKYSRHPNYFFEWIHWWGYVCLSIGASFWWTTLLAPLAMLYFLFKVTGIPPTEAQCLKSRGDKYREYQRTTSPFVPWPPKKEASI